MRWTQRPVVGSVVITMLALVTPGCGSDTERLNVFAAASLGPVMADVEQEFEAANPEVDVVVNLAGSSTLAAQIVAGADAAVFASANVAQMDVVRDGLGVGAATVFATNALVIVVAPDNPLGIAGADDLARPDVVVALAAPEVPAGAYALEMLGRAGVEVAPSTLELDVRAVVRIEPSSAHGARAMRATIGRAKSATAMPAGTRSTRGRALRRRLMVCRIPRRGGSRVRSPR